MNNRVAYYDQMKGLAIILVVIGHVTQFSFGLHGSVVNRWLEIFHMPIFFYISGYFAYKTFPSIKDVFSRCSTKIHAIAIPLVAWCALWVITHGDESLMQMLARCGGKYWFLYTLTLLSVFFLLYEHIVKRIKNQYIYTACWLLPLTCLMLIKVKTRGGG